MLCPAQAPIKKILSTQIKLNHSRRARASREREEKSAARPGLHHTVAAVATEILQISPETRRIPRNPRLRCPARPVPVQICRASDPDRCCRSAFPLSLN